MSKHMALSGQDRYDPFSRREHLQPREEVLASSYESDEQTLEQGGAASAAEEVSQQDNKLNQSSVGRSSAMMSGLVIVSRITGFLRTWCQSFALGLTIMSSCYTVANNLPNQLYELVMGGMLITAFLPVYLSVRRRLGRTGANTYASNLISLVTIAMAVATIAGFIFADQVVWTQSAGATSEFDTDTTIYLFRFFVVEIVLYALSSLFSGILNAERDYFWSTAAPIFNNFVCSASFLAYAFLVGSNPHLAVLVLALGNPAGVAVQVLLQIPALRRHGIHIRFHIDLHEPALRETLSIGIPSLVITLISFVTTAVQTSCSLWVTPQGASVAYYSRMWYILPYSVFAIPITTAMFTELADYSASNRMTDFRNAVSFGLKKIVFILIPFTFMLVIFAPELVTILAAGKFSSDDIALTVGYLRALSCSLPFYGICTYLQKVCSSLRKMGIFTLSNSVAGIIQVAFCLTLTKQFGLNIVGISSVFFFVVIDVIVIMQLRHKIGSFGMRSVGASALWACGFGVAGSLVGVGIIWALQTSIGPLGSSVMQSIGYAAIAGIPAVLVAFGGAAVMGRPEASFIQTLFSFIPTKKSHHNGV